MIGALSDENCEGLTPKPLSQGINPARHHREREEREGERKEGRERMEGGGRGDKTEKKREEKEGESNG